MENALIENESAWWMTKTLNQISLLFLLIFCYYFHFDYDNDLCANLCGIYAAVRRFPKTKMQFIMFRRLKRITFAWNAFTLKAHL